MVKNNESQSLLIQGRFQQVGHGKSVSFTNKSQSLLIQGRFQLDIEDLRRQFVYISQVAIPSDSGQVSTRGEGIHTDYYVKFRRNPF